MTAALLRALPTPPAEGAALNPNPNPNPTLTLTLTLTLALALAPTLTLAPTLALPLTCAGERWPQEDQGFLGAAQVRAGRADGGRQGASAHAAADLHRALRQLSPCRRP